MISTRDVGIRLITVLWVGSLWTIGYIVAPGLFANAVDSETAGALAGVFFSIEAWLTLICGTLLILLGLAVHKPEPGHKIRLGLVLFMVACMAVGEWGLRPLMDAARETGTGEGSRFALLHGGSAALYLLTSLAGIALVAMGNSARSEIPE